jgi:hypothetical protein
MLLTLLCGNLAADCKLPPTFWFDIFVPLALFIQIELVKKLVQFLGVFIILFYDVYIQILWQSEQISGSRDYVYVNFDAVLVS